MPRHCSVCGYVLNANLGYWNREFEHSGKCLQCAGVGVTKEHPLGWDSPLHLSGHMLKAEQHRPKVYKTKDTDYNYCKCGKRKLKESKQCGSCAARERWKY